MKLRKTADFFKRLQQFVMLFALQIIFWTVLPMTVFAEADKTTVVGNVFEFDKGSHYEFHEDCPSKKTAVDNTYGVFSISGNIVTDGEKSGVPSYEVSENALNLYYNYGDTKLNADLDKWHLVDDKSDKVADMTLDSDIMKGTIIIQTSKDKKNWVDVETIYNAFSDVPIRTNAIYTATDVELINGCYYRVVVVYELRIRTEESKFMFINTDKYDYKKYAEIYEFYAHASSCENNEVIPDQTYSLGEKVRAKNFDGYFGEELIKQGDPHYGWELGDFFVSGYTDEVVKDDGSVVFLKNVGDKVTLWFRLNQNIDGLNNNEKLSITPDTEGYDQYFETQKMNFGRGVLIIQYTDHNNVKAEPVIYTNYLEANASVNADTKVQLFEEGDYEVALDYEVTDDELLNKIGHYRIFFKFSVRNGNCMVYPFDVATGDELTNSSMTENGFRLDLAKSRYLQINIKREMLKDSADGLVEDTRFNGVAKDGAEYTDEGIYTITVSNEYTGQLTTKKIYVGTNNILKAHIITGLSIPEINDLVADGAIIFEDGTIQLATEKSAEESTETEKLQSDMLENDKEEVSTVSDDLANTDVQKESLGGEVAPLYLIIAAGAGIFILIVIGIVLIKKRKKPVETDNICNDDEGRIDE